MTFSVTILGSNSATPAYGRHPTAQVVNHYEKLFLVDCGEGTQMQFERYHIKRSRVEHIFISHLHGDHYFGLIGLLTSFALNKRSKPLWIYAPADLKNIIEVHLNVTGGWENLGYEIYWYKIAFDAPQVIYENNHLSVETIILNHSLPCVGFLFREKMRGRNIHKHKIEEFQLSIESIAHIKAGGDYTTPEGVVVSNQELTYEALPPRAYAFCTDTTIIADNIAQLKGVHTLYHEATFLSEHAERAAATLHSTAAQAALFARDAQIGQLLLGHFSAKYSNLEPLLQEAKDIFSNTALAIEGVTFHVLQQPPKEKNTADL